ncbi:hypothetical protein Tco_1167366 [Tanacetum coccineum]
MHDKFRSSHSTPSSSSKEDLIGTRIEYGFKRAFMSLFGQDHDTFTSTMFLNVDQLQKQLDKDEFQEDGSMAAFWVVMSRSLLLKEHVIKIQYDKESIRTDSIVQYDNNRSGNDTDADDVDIRPIYDEEPMAEILYRTKFSPKKTSGFEDKPSHRSDLSGNPRVEFSNLLSLSVFLIESFIRALTQQGTSINVQKEQSLDLSTEVHQAAETVTTSNELDLLFGPLFDEYFNGENQVVLKSSAVTTTDASNKRQQQPDSTSSTSTLATTVTANGNFDL